MAVAAHRLGVLAGQLEAGGGAVVELEAGLPGALRVTGRARGRHLVEPAGVLVVPGVTALAGRLRLLLAERSGVAAVACDLGVLADQRVAGLLPVIELDLDQRAQRRRVAALALLRREQLSVVRALVALRAVTAIAGELERCLRVALGARHVGVGADQRHRCLGAVAVVELEALLRRLPLRLAVAALAAQVDRADLAVRLVLAVTAGARAVGVEIGPQALLVDGAVTARAVGDRVLAAQLPAGELVIERLGPTDRAPPHEVEAAAAVLLVADLARPVLDLGRRVKALAGIDPLLEILVVVAREALGGRHRLVALVAGRALILAVDRGVAGGELAGGRLEEVVGAHATRDHQGGSDREVPGSDHDHSSVLIPIWNSCAVSMRRVRVAPGWRVDIPVHSVVARSKS